MHHRRALRRARVDGGGARHDEQSDLRQRPLSVLRDDLRRRRRRAGLRRGSGGAGRWRGGDGVVRRIRFREAMTAAMLGDRRRVPPYGLAGGEPGALARNWVERSSGAREEFGGTAVIEVRAGDVFVIETPGGGGYGKA